MRRRHNQAQDNRDRKQSGLDADTRRQYRIAPFKITDDVHDAMILLSARPPPEEVEGVILEFTNAVEAPTTFMSVRNG